MPREARERAYTARAERSRAAQPARPREPPSSTFPLRASALLDHALASLGAGDARRLELQLATFARFLLLHMAARDWVKLAGAPGATRLALAAGFSACFAASLAAPARLQTLLCAALGLATWKLLWNVPDPSNHFVVEYLCLLCLCLLRSSRNGEREALAASLRWLAAWVFLASGLQKVLHGTYFSGAYLATLAAQERFALVLGGLLDPGDLAAFSDPAFEGPYRLRSAAGLALSNAVYAAEIVAALLLIARRTRAAGVLLGLLTLAAIQVGARELMFGALLTALLTLHASERATRCVYALAACAYPWLIAAAFGWVKLGFFN